MGPENRRKTKSQAGQPKVVKKVCWIGGGRSTLTCKQVRRKLVSGENEKQNQQKQNGRRRRVGCFFTRILKRRTDQTKSFLSSWPTGWTKRRRVGWTTRRGRRSP